MEDNKKYRNKLSAAYVEMYNDVVYYVVKKGETIENPKISPLEQHYRVDISNAKIFMKLYLCGSMQQQLIEYIDVFVYPEINGTDIMIITDKDKRYKFSMLDLLTQADIVDYLINS